MQTLRTGVHMHETKHYTTGEAAKRLGVHTSTVYRWCAAGHLRAHRTSQIGKWRITEESLAEYASLNSIPLLGSEKEKA